MCVSVGGGCGISFNLSRIARSRRFDNKRIIGTLSIYHEFVTTAAESARISVTSTELTEFISREITFDDREVELGSNGIHFNVPRKHHNAILINRFLRALWAESNFHNHSQAPATSHSHGALAVNLLIHSIETRTFPSKLQFTAHTSAAPPIELHRFSSLASRWRELLEIEFKFSAKRRAFTGIELFRTIYPCRRQRYFVYLIRINFSQQTSEGIVVTRPSESSLQR